MIFTEMRKSDCRINLSTATLNLELRLKIQQEMRLLNVMDKQFPLQAFFEHSQAARSKLPDHRKPNPNTKYVLSDAVNSAFTVYFMQSQSFLAHHQAMSGKRKGKQNLHTLFQFENVPSDNQIRNLLDSLGPLEFAP